MFLGSRGQAYVIDRFARQPAERAGIRTATGWSHGRHTTAAAVSSSVRISALRAVERNGFHPAFLRPDVGRPVDTCPAGLSPHASSIFQTLLPQTLDRRTSRDRG